MAEYIDKEAATALAPLPKELREYQTANLDDAFEYGYDFAIGQIDAIPAADVKPVVRGKWEHFGSDVFRCSGCGYGIQPWNIGVNFCPNCGADMKGE